MKLIPVADPEALSARAFGLAERLIARRRVPRVVLPTGNTPLGFYAAAVRHGPGSALSRARFIQLDEYLDIARDDRRALSGWLARIFLGPLAIAPSRLIAFDSATPAPAVEAARVEAAARRDGIELALLGLGPNGHLGFNEPGSAFDSPTREVPLTPESITSNAVYWGGEEHVPRRAFTLGLGTLATARASILMVSGRHKAEILRRTLLGPVSTDVPATGLRRLPRAYVVADRAALSALGPDEIGRLSRRSVG